jgi:hypothetical protein
VRVEPEPGELASALRAELDAITDAVLRVVTDAVVRMAPKAGSVAVERELAAQMVQQVYLAAMSDSDLVELGVRSGAVPSPVGPAKNLGFRHRQPHRRPLRRQQIPEYSIGQPARS